MITRGRRDLVLLLGPPGAGKGTQARFIGEALGVPHVASGDLLRDHRRRNTPLGSAAQAYMDRGDLVPDQLVIDMVMERLNRPDAERGALLDGFPRTQAQAHVLDRSLEAQGEAVRAALYLDVPKAVLVERLAGRWLCGSCQATYPSHPSSPASAGVCSACGDRLYQRADDRPDVVEKRVEVYLRETLPVIEHYAARGVLKQVDGNASIENVRARLCVALGGVVRGQRRSRWHLYLNQPCLAGDGRGRWHGRTLCGKYVDRLLDRELGSLEAFEATPCRRCRRVLRPRQRPSVGSPAAAGTATPSGG